MIDGSKTPHAATDLPRALAAALTDVDSASTDATKSRAVRALLAARMSLAENEISVKHLAAERNFGNRLAEALHAGPRLLVVIEPELGVALEPLVSRLTELEHPPTTLVCSRAKGGWFVSSVVGTEGSQLLAVVRAEVPEAQVVLVESRPPTPVVVGAPRADRVDFESLLHGLPLSGTSATKFDPLCSAVADYFGIDATDVTCKALTQARNYYNRLGEAMASRPAMIVVVVPGGPSTVFDALVKYYERSSIAPRPVLCVGLRPDGSWHAAWYSSPPSDPFLVRVLAGLMDRRFVFSEDSGAAQVRARDRLAEQPPPSAPEARSSPWRSWDYAEWNRRLVARCLGVDPTLPEVGPVTRLVATPEELAAVAGAPSEEAEELTSEFARLCLANAPRGTSFCGFCLDHMGRKARAKHAWTVNSTKEPHFFAMLWFTCLVQYGWPPGSPTGFHERMWELLEARDQLSELPSVWEDLRNWTLAMHRAGRGIRELVLPPEDVFRKRIGASYYLAFPHAGDRRALAEVLQDAGLVGFEPPLEPVITALRRSEARFSSHFRDDLENFVARYVTGTEDARNSPFWRAVRAEALDPTPLRSAGGCRQTMLAVLDDEGLVPVLAVAGECEFVSGYSVLPMEDVVDTYDGYLADASGSLEEVAMNLLAGRLDTNPGVTSLVRQGLLVFRPYSSAVHMIATGDQLVEADTALVRENLADAFLEEFGGRDEPSRFPGWREVVGCSVRQLDELPPVLASVLQLRPTMSPPGVSLVGGVRTDGGFLSVAGLLPRVRAKGAARVDVEIAGVVHSASAKPDDDWELPTTLGGAVGEVKIVAEWPARERRVERTIRLDENTFSDDFKPVASGAYHLESCRPGQREASGGAPIPLFVTTSSRERTIDLLPLEPTARYLGPGLGEMALVREPRHEWLAVGPKKKPDLLVFIGDPDRPRGPEHVRSPSDGDRRHWTKAWAKSERVVVRLPDGRYVPEATRPLVAQVRSAMRAARVSSSAPQCTPTNLDAVLAKEPRRVPHPRSASAGAVDALAALACRRSGLRYRTIRDILCVLTQQDDPLLHAELIRAWSESGAWDLVRRQDRSATFVVPRRARFVAFLRGPDAEATLVGLPTSQKLLRLAGVLRSRGIWTEYLDATSPWQPELLRVRCPVDELDRISNAACLEPVEWIRWDDPGSVPEHLAPDPLGQELRSDPPPVGFRLDAVWDWARRRFSRSLEVGDDAAVRVERRTHSRRCSIYVVLDGDRPWAWTYIGNWALLLAYELRGEPPFELDASGSLHTKGDSPVHLPLPWGRICAVLGQGAPGPILDAATSRVKGYRYPLGPRLAPLVQRSIPPAWLAATTK